MKEDVKKKIQLLWLFGCRVMSLGAGGIMFGWDFIKPIDIHVHDSYFVSIDNTDIYFHAYYFSNWVI